MADDPKEIKGEKVTEKDARARESAAPKKRGRPPGSKSHKKGEGKNGGGNKSEDEDEAEGELFDWAAIPDDVIGALALAPLQIASLASMMVRGKRLIFQENPCKVVQHSFKKWVLSKEIRVTPGLELSLAFATAIYMATSEDATPAEVVAEAQAQQERARANGAAVSQAATQPPAAESPRAANGTDGDPAAPH